ncbi:MAG: hypothetical protein WBP45_07835 [Daejeonella sp.]
MHIIKIILSFVLLSVGVVNAQNSYQKMGQKALIDGNFKLAVTNLEKAIVIDSNNVSTLYMLGYSYYHSLNYKKAVSAFNKVLVLKSGEVAAYYYRGKAQSNMANDIKSLSNFEREKLLSASIKDFSTAIQLSTEDIKLYQNRGLAYLDYGILKAQKLPKVYDKKKSANAFKLSIEDFQKILDFNPGRKDITSKLETAKEYLRSLK